MGENAAPEDPHKCAKCGTLLCNWVHQGAERCCFCAELGLEETCGPCADLAEADDA